MEDTSSANRRKDRNGFDRALYAMLVMITLVPLRAYTQCSPDATGWLVKLALVEGAAAEAKEKISRLSALKDEFNRCQAPKDSVYARIVHRLGDLYRIDGDFERGIQYTSEAIEINKANAPGAQRSYLTHSYYNLGLYNNLLGLPADAHLYYDSCIEMGIKYSAKLFIALMAMEKKAFLYFQEGDYEQGIRISERGKLLARKHNMPMYEAVLLIQKAQCESELNRITEAGENISRAIEMLNSNGLESYLPNAYSVYALVLSRQKQFDEAISYYTKASELNLAQANRAQAARDLHDLGFLYDKQLNDASKARAQYSRALAIFESLRDPYMIAATYNNLGQVCWRSKDLEAALHYYQKGLMALPIQFHARDVKVNPTRSGLSAVSNEYIAAALLWNKGDSWLALFESENDSESLKHAVAAYRAGDYMVDKMRWKQHGEQSKLFWRQKTKQWYENAIKASFLQDSPEEAFYFMEKSRAVLLNDKLAELGAKNQLPPEEAEREKYLRMKLQTIAAKASAEPDSPLLVDQLWRARESLNNFIAELEELYPAYYTYKYDTAVFSVSDLQQHLARSDQSWIELFTTENAIFALTITPRHAKLARISFGDHAQIAKKIRDLCSSKGAINRNFNEYLKLSNLYYNKVFKPLSISSRRVAISHDEYFLPFDLLHTDSTDQTSFLLKQHAFTYAYSAAHVLRRTTGNASKGQSLLAVAPVNYKPDLNLQDLRGADESLKKIQVLYNGGQLLTDSAATKQTFLRQIPSFEVVHLYSHATADSIGQEPAIYLYDSAINLSELQNLRDLNTQLIVLFACNTGVGKSVKGEGIFSLARGFAAAGIPATISALWEIDNHATYNLAELFFKHLANGEPSDLALQAAKMDLIAGGQYELPYYWAGAVVIGKADRYRSANTLSFISRVMYTVVLAVVCLLATIFLVVRKRKKLSRCDALV